MDLIDRGGKRVAEPVREYAVVVRVRRLAAERVEHLRARVRRHVLDELLRPTHLLLLL